MYQIMSCEAPGHDLRHPFDQGVKIVFLRFATLLPTVERATEGVRVLDRSAGEETVYCVAVGAACVSLCGVDGRKR